MVIEESKRNTWADVTRWLGWEYMSLACWRIWESEIEIHIFAGEVKGVEIDVDVLNVWCFQL